MRCCPLARPTTLCLGTCTMQRPKLLSSTRNGSSGTMLMTPLYINFKFFVPSRVVLQIREPSDRCCEATHRIDLWGIVTTLRKRIFSDGLFMEEDGRFWSIELDFCRFCWEQAHEPIIAVMPLGFFPSAPPMALDGTVCFVAVLICL